MYARSKVTKVRWIAVALLLVALIALTSVALIASAGGDYLLDWWTVDAGGTITATGGGYTLGGTAGQHDADPAPATGGGYELQGGFWHAPADVPTADDPAEEPTDTPWWQDALRIFLPTIGN